MYKQFKLTSGEELICELVEANDADEGITDVIIRRAMKIVTTDDLEESLEKRKNNCFYRHWFQWALKIKKYDFINVCEELAGFWETSYSTNDIEDIVSKLKKDDSENSLEFSDKFNFMPNKIFIYNDNFAFMFERTDESESIFIDKVIEP